ncbi:hypothetical protein [Rubritalea tangerina]|uniref:hypothetical protein n=1 Tax=Rubritalea tangerina TaxID=430798 RepID=UPI00361D1B07
MCHLSFESYFSCNYICRVFIFFCLVIGSRGYSDLLIWIKTSCSHVKSVNIFRKVNIGQKLDMFSSIEFNHP